MRNPVPHDVWRDCCHHAEAAKLVAPAYEDLSVYHFPLTNVFVIATTGAGVKELANEFLKLHVLAAFANSATGELLKQVDQYRKRGKLND